MGFLRVAVLVLLAVPAIAGADELARINDGIESWIERIDSDRPFLLLDLGAAQLRLQHGSAILRSVPVLAVSGEGSTPVSQRLQGRLRRYGAVPFQPIVAGPFDWEQYLAHEADDECALLFDGGLLMYAHDEWSKAPAPTARLASADLRALFDAVPDSVELVLLPAGWDMSPLRETR